MISRLLTAGILLVSAAQEIDHTKDSLDTVKSALDKKEAVLVDVREKGEWAQGHLEGAVFVPLSWLKTESKGDNFAEHAAEKLPAKKILYLHCRSGGRALTAAGLLKKAGYDVRPLKQGFDELKDAGFPVAEK
ncbi:MAG TPA: rhodanese-like domain-containing protein [Planctomycetota bacterium]|nr:rhodanese-like domain-containing protein [Planctomycetota bacterium]